MDARELRIDNWIQCRPKSSTDKESGWRNIRVDAALIYAMCHSKPYFEHRYIPLTEEILLKCGFEKNIREDDFDYWTHKEIGEEIWQHDEGFCHNLCYGGDINYLHSLQNLFFAITGEELNIEL